MSNENKEAMPKGVYDCRVVSVNRSTKKGNEAHFVLNVGIEPIKSECERCGITNPATYYVEFPLVFVVGQEYRFYDKEKNQSVAKKCVAMDTDTAITFARRIFPEWAEYMDGLPEGTKPRIAFEWFNGDEPKKCCIRASLNDPREYNGKLYYQARFIAKDTERVAVADDFDLAFGNALKASGVKIGKAKKVEVAASVANAPTTPTAPAPTSSVPAPSPAMPTTPKTASAYSLDREGAWKCYEKNCLADDPQGAHFWERIGTIVGKDAADWAAFTAEDWQKVIENFDAPF